MIVGQIEQIDIEDKVRFQSKVKSLSGDFYVKFDVSQKWAEYVDTDVHDAFLVSILLNAMRNGEDVFVDGLISEKLFYNITNSLMPMLKGILPNLKDVKLEVAGIRGSQGTNLGAVATGCSGGVDSFYAISYHLSHSVSNSYKLSHLLFNCNGSNKMKSLAEPRFKIVKEIAERSGLPLIRVDSNHGQFSHFKYHESHNFRHVSSVLLFQKLFSKYYFSSTFSFSDCHIRQANSSAYSDPFILNLFSTEKTEIIPFGLIMNVAG